MWQASASFVWSLQMAEEIRVLHHHAGGLGIDQAREIFLAGRIRLADHELELEESGMGLADFAVVGMQIAGDDGAVPAGDAVGHHDRLGGRRGAVIHGGVGDLHAGDEADLGLEFEEILQRALRDFRLIGRVGGQELAALDQMVDRGGYMVAIGAGAQEAGHGGATHVLRGHGADGALDLEFALIGGQIDRFRQTREFRHVAIEGIDRGHADPGQHGPAIGVGQRQIAHQCSPST